MTTKTTITVTFTHAGCDHRRTYADREAAYRQIRACDSIISGKYALPPGVLALARAERAATLIALA